MNSDNKLELSEESLSNPTNNLDISLADEPPIETKIKKITPLPVAKITLLGFILAANNASIWMIFSFAPFMVEYYYPNLTKNEIGYKAGIIGSAFSTGSLLGNFMWGVISDKIGRRPALLYGLFGTFISSLLFGFAPNFNIAIFSRFMWGFLNGNIGVSKTYMGEILDDTNTSKGMSIYGVIGGIGRTIGPLIGGCLSMPAKHYKFFKNTIFQTFPFLLPCLVVSINCLIILIVSYFELNETLNINLSTTNTTNNNNDNKIKKKIILKSKSKNHTKYIQLSNDDSSDSLEIELTTPKDVSPTNRRLLSLDGNDDIEQSVYNPISQRKLYSQVYRYDPDLTDEEIKEAVSPNEEENDSIPTTIPIHKPRVSFTGYVMVKHIDSNDITYTKLNQINENDLPIDSITSDKFVATPVALNHQNNHEKQDLSNDSFTIPIESDLPNQIPIYSNGSEDYLIKKPNDSFLITIYKLLRNKEIFISTLLYGINCFAQLASNEIVPLWLVTSKKDGGFEYDSYRIGLATMITGPVSIIFQVIFYPKMVEKYGILHTYMLGVLLFVIAMIFIPCISLLNQFNSSILIFIAVVIGLSSMSISVMSVLTTIFILINNSCYSYQRGTVNGIGQTFASLGRLQGPFIGGNVFAWSETNHCNWPLNYYFTFYLLAIFGIFCMRMGSLLPKSIQRRKREPKVLRYTIFDNENE